MRRPWETLRTLCYPQRNHCHLCETALTAGDGCLCARCTLHLSWLRIHSPQDLAGLNQSLAAYQHLAQARQLILQLKYQGNGAAAEPLAEGMCDLLIDFWPKGGFDVAVPVPMHPTIKPRCWPARSAVTCPSPWTKPRWRGCATRPRRYRPTASSAPGPCKGLSARPVLRASACF